MELNEMPKIFIEYQIRLDRYLYCDGLRDPYRPSLTTSVYIANEDIDEVKEKGWEERIIDDTMDRLKRYLLEELRREMENDSNNN